MTELVSHHPTTAVRVVAVRHDHTIEKPDRVVTEEPMEIQAGGPGQAVEPVAVTMRTPGHDFELAVGFLYTEGLIAADDVAVVKYCDLPEGEPQQFNVVTVCLRHRFEGPQTKPFTTTASCGICGKASLDEVEVHCTPVPPGPAGMVDAASVAQLPDRLRSAQQLFGETGGLHAAGLFTAAGDLVVIREDVGRHNAVDKLVGHAVLNSRLPLSDHVLMVSGRVSFEIVQKAAMAGIPVLCAVSAPSSLAIQAAERLGLTVVGFVRDGTCNVYSHAARVAVTGPTA